MPTGYTSDIKDGISFEQFVWTCARGFGALVLMRDEPLGAPIPARFEPSPYYAESVTKAETALAKFRALTTEQASAECVAEHQAALQSWAQRCEEKKALREKYLRMLAKVKEWQPPTPEHVGLRDFMVQQLTDSMDWDCSTKYDTRPEAMTTEAWLAAVIQRAERDLERAKESLREEIERTEGRNQWLKALRESVPYPNAA